MDDMQPGQLIVPHEPEEPQAPATVPVQPATTPPPPPPAPETPVNPIAPVVQPVPQPPVSAPTSTEDVTASTGWQYTAEEAGGSSQPELPAEGLEWTASEFIAHDKSPAWYGTLMLAAVVSAGIVYLLTRDVISTVVVLFVAIAFAVFAGRKPNTQQYSLSTDGLRIGQKLYDFQDFKTFSVSQDGAIASVILMPLKRFMPPITLYIAPDLADNVLDYLGSFLPFEQHKTDAIDGLLKRIRF